MPVLRARVGGVWVDVGGGVDEVSVGATAPTDSAVELWYDTSAVPVFDPAKMPRGYIGQASNSSNQSVVSANAWVDITGCSVTFTADPTRRYKTTVKTSFQKLTAGGYMYSRITDAAGATSLEQLGSTQAINEYGGHSFSRIDSGLSGTTVRKLQGLNETNGVTWFGLTNDRCLIFVEDIGGV